MNYLGLVVGVVLCVIGIGMMSFPHVWITTIEPAKCGVCFVVPVIAMLLGAIVITWYSLELLNT